MADAARHDVDVDRTARRGGGGGLIAGLVGLAAFGGGGFYATYSGLLALPFGGAGQVEAPAPTAPKGDVAFVPLGQLTISLGPTASARYLRLSGTLEVDPQQKEAVAALMPRILDVMNTYLQALDETDVSRPAAMSRMRAHLLRRIRIVTGDDGVNDLLITEFILQ